MSEQRPTVSPRVFLSVLMAGLAVWAIYVAVGAYWYNMNPWRGVIVLACMGLFLGFWLVLLWNQSRQRR